MSAFLLDSILMLNVWLTVFTSSSKILNSRSSFWSLMSWISFSSWSSSPSNCLTCNIPTVFRPWNPMILSVSTILDPTRYPLVGCLGLNCSTCIYILYYIYISRIWKRELNFKYANSNYCMYLLQQLLVPLIQQLLLLHPLHILRDRQS